MNNTCEYKFKMAKFNRVRLGAMREGWEGGDVAHGHPTILVVFYL